MASKRRRQRTLLQTALRGGAAGMVGGLAITLIEREVLSRVMGSARHRSNWDDLAARGLSRVGVELGDRGRIATGVVAQVAYAGLLGEKAVVIIAAIQTDVVENAALAVEVDFITVRSLRDADAWRQRQ